MHTLNLGSALHECISFHSRRAAAHCDVIEDLTNGVRATRSGAGIFAFVVHTRTIPWTVRIENALRTTIGVRISAELGQTSTDAIATLCIRTTWARIAGIRWNGVGSCDESKSMMIVS